MNELPIHDYYPQASQLVYGCMGLGGAWDNAPCEEHDVRKAREVIETCLENPIISSVGCSNLFTNIFKRKI